MQKLYIPILLGSAREGCSSRRAAEYLSIKAHDDGRFESEIVACADYLDAPRTGGMSEEHEKRWSETMNRADGLIIITPEYNHGYPGELKLMLDQIYEEYARKPVAICGVSKSPMGGVRVVEALRLVAVELSLVPIHTALYFSNVREMFLDGGMPKDSSYDNRTAALFDELVWYAQALRVARTQK